MKNHFWARWAREYLHTLQQRGKWRKPVANLEVGDKVLIIDPSLLRHGRWPIGRIEQIHPGRDALVRVVTVRTSSGTYTRPVTKLCPLQATA